MSCDPACFECLVTECDDLIVNAGLEYETTYFVLIRKSHSDILYQRKITTPAQVVDGPPALLTIPKSLFPDGYFTKGNNYWLQLRTDENYLTVKDLTINTKTYPCAVFSIVSIDVEAGDESQINLIGESFTMPA